jgi:hypothetical protein
MNLSRQKHDTIFSGQQGVLHPGIVSEAEDGAEYKPKESRVDVI